jgi:hypothetical protein
LRAFYFGKVVRSQKKIKKEEFMKKFLPYMVLIAFILVLTACNKLETGVMYYDDTDSIYYEGELLDGEPNGRGIAYNQEGSPIYEGHFENGKIVKEGYGKEYWSNGNLMFEGYFNGGERLEGNVFDESGSFQGYIPYAPISVVGEWVASDAMNNNDEIYDIQFNEDGSYQATNNEDINGTYELQDYTDDTSETNLIMKDNNTTGITSGNISFNNKNLFSFYTTKNESILFVRKGSEAGIDY